MNHRDAKQHLFDKTFLLGAGRRRRALKFLFEKGDADAVQILIDAVDRNHVSSSTIQQFLAQLSDRESVELLVASWTAKRQPWLGPIAVDRALSTGAASALPLDRQTAWLVVPHVSAGGQRAAAAEAYVQRAIQQQPDFVPALVLKL